MNGTWVEPQINQELECLNTTSEVINQLENEISERRMSYRTALTESTRKLNRLSGRLGDSVGKARPYYEMKRKAKEAQTRCQEAAVRFERSVSMHTAAREMVLVAEQGMLKDANRMDTAWPEMLNHATIKVNESEIERMNSEKDHQEKADAFKEATFALRKLEKKLKSNIAKSRPYFEEKQLTQRHLEELSNAVKAVDTKLHQAKLKYSQALRNLENISNAIHASRDKLPIPQSPAISTNSSCGFGSMEDCSSIQTVMSDLKKFDSVDRLDQLSDTSSNDTSDGPQSEGNPPATTPTNEQPTTDFPPTIETNNNQREPPKILVIASPTTPTKGNSPQRISPGRKSNELVISIAGLAEVSS